MNIAGTLSVASGGSNVNVSGGTLNAATLGLAGNYTQSGGIATFSQITGAGQASITGGTMSLILGGSASQLDDLSVGGTGALDLQLGGYTQGVTYDLLDVNDVASLGGTLEVDLVNGFMPSIGDQFTVITAGGGVTGAFANLTSDDPGLNYTVDYGPGNNLVRLTITSVPEPGGIAATALGGLLLLRRKAREVL